MPSPTVNLLGSNPLFDLDSFRVPSTINDCFYIPNFISAEEEQYLLRKIYESSRVRWRPLPERRLQIWGGNIVSNTLFPRPLPGFVTDHPPIISKLRNTGAFRASKHGEPNHIIVNEYHPGQGIMPHEDGPCYYPVVATISLGSHAVFHYHQYRPDTESSSYQGKSIEPHPILSLLLEQRSLVITAKELYRTHLHSIEPVECDIILPGGPHRDWQEEKDGQDGYRIGNWELLGDEGTRRIASDGGVLDRNLRVSLTCRDVERISNTAGPGFRA